MTQTELSATVPCKNYTCISPLVPSPVVIVSSLPESELVSGSLLSLTCSIQPRGDSSVDTSTTVMSSWDAPNSTYDRVNTANEMSVGLVISSVQTADSGDYICSASVTDSSDSVYVVDSDTATDMVDIIVSKSLPIVRVYMYIYITVKI